MRQNCKKRIVDLIKQIKNLEANQKCTDIMLIIDEFTSPLLSSIVVQFFSLGVKNITKVSLKKKPQPKFAGLYFISQQSLSTIAEDFKNGPIYHSINILLCEQITRQIMKRIADEKVIMQRLAFFGELLLNVKYPSNNISMICTQNSLFASSIKGQITIAPQVLSTKIFQALISGFDSNFRLKIYFGNTKYIQKLVEQMSVKYASLTKQKQSEIVLQVKQTQKEHKNLNLLLVDRRSDLISPLVRNFYYMNMISDIFKVDFQKKEVLLRTQRTINFNYDDPIFSQYKYLHISKIPSLVQPDFKEFKTSNKAAQLSQDKGNGNIASMDLKQIIRDIPQFNKKVKSYEQQIQIIDQITQLSKEEKLPQIGQVQQMIISGVGGHGEEIPDKRILERSLEVCNTINDPQKIIRILVLLLFCLNLSQNQKKSVLNRIKSFPKYATLAKLLQEKLPHILPKPAKLKLSSQRERLFLHMHESLVESIMIEILQRQVSKQVSLKILGDQKKKKQSKFQKISKKQQKNWIVCIIGGISFNEIVQLQRLKMRYENLELSFICTEILAGWSYLEKLEKVWSQ